MRLTDLFTDARLAKLDAMEPIEFSTLLDPSLSERTAQILSNPELLDIVCSYVAAGGTAVSLANCWEIRYGDLMNWIRSNPERDKRYETAMLDRTEWIYERVLRELRSIASSDIKALFDDEGAIKPISEWPDSISRAVSSIEVNELWGTNEDGKKEQIGVTKKVKFWDKLKAVELIGKNMGMFVEKHVVEGKLTLEHLVAQAGKPALPEGEKK